MAIYFWNAYSRVHQSRNFGDDINPWLLSKIFDDSIVSSKKTCIVGIGTLLDKEKMESISHYENKIIFSTGAGYGTKPADLDGTWDVACVRGPETARLYNLPDEKAVCDGAILMPDFLKFVQKRETDTIVFIPHINSIWEAGRELSAICESCGFVLLSPAEEVEKFVETIQSAKLVITEAMHGAIISDAYRTPWICCKVLYHNEFKWRDWCGAMELEYSPCRIEAYDVEKPKNWIKKIIWKLFGPIRIKRSVQELNKIKLTLGSLSAVSVLELKKQNLRDIADNINSKYSEKTP